MTRRIFIERELRQLYNGFWADESDITDNLINSWLSDAVGVAAKQCYKDNIQLEGVGFLNNAFYCTFKGIAVTKDEQFLYKFTLPDLPVGLGATDGISRVLFKDVDNKLSYPVILLSENQVGIQRSMRPIPNKVLCYPEGIFCYIITTIIMSDYTATVTMASGGDSTNLDSVFNVPPDYIPIIVQYVKEQMLFEKSQPKDTANDGQSIP